MTLLENFIQNEKGFLKQYAFVLAVSGGVDSVVLSDLFSKAEANFFIAHCNFQLRGEESERDEAFVRKLAEKYGKEIFVKKFETEDYAAEHKISIQLAARDLRYDWFRELVQSQTSKVKSLNENNLQHPISNIFITTAHHADDNIETVVMNFFRGTGLKGLTGMDAHYKEIYRPLLLFRKKEILNYAKENNLEFVEDSSNANNYYTRNFFRNDLLPAISKVFPNVEENILNNIERLSDTAAFFQHAMENQIKKLVEIKGNEELIPILKLQKVVSYKTVLWEIIKGKNFSAAQVDEVIKLLDADNGSYIESQTHRIIKNRKWIIIANKKQDYINELLIIDEGTNKVKYAGGELRIEKISISNFTLSTDKNIAALNADEIKFPLILRKWKRGDYFYPLGMKKKKKLSKFFIDQKLSLTEKENAWVLEMNKKIIWVIDHRIDDRFKIMPSNTNIIKITFKP